MADIKAIAEELVNLTVKEVNELVLLLVVQLQLRRSLLSTLSSLRLVLQSSRL